MTQKPAKFRAPRIDRSLLARALGLSARDLDTRLPIEEVSTGIFNLMVPLRRRTALRRIVMDLPALHKLLHGKSQVLYCFAPGAHGKVFARGMLPWHLQEDPATGSAGGSLGAYLVRHKKLSAGQALEILQGVEMGRPSKIHVEVAHGPGKQLTPRVRGSAVLILEGTIDA
jgi:trans-2,3-dihydro-3-hydroxyanthranilate isomerase